MDQTRKDNIFIKDHMEAFNHAIAIDWFKNRDTREYIKVYS